MPITLIPEHMPVKTASKQRPSAMVTIMESARGIVDSDSDITESGF
jgi:hypothetical protein